MAIDLSKVKSRLNGLKNANNKSNLIWKPTPGTHQIRIVPYKHSQDENSFIELKFHYNLNNKTYLSPDSFGQPDPIVEWANKLKKGSKEDWKLGQKMSPKLRTYVPILVRKHENEGVKYWAFGKTVYEELLKVVADPDFGDITHPDTGRDITIEYQEAATEGAFPQTTIRVKPNQSPAIDPANKDVLDNQINILELFPQYTYAELKEVMNQYLLPQASEQETTVNTVVDEEATTPITPSAINRSQSAAGSKENSDVEAKFKALFPEKK
jgi:hypothetical protein